MTEYIPTFVIVAELFGVHALVGSTTAIHSILL